MSTVTFELTNEESDWLTKYCHKAGFKNTSDGIKATLKVCGALPKEQDYFFKLLNGIK